MTTGAGDATFYVTGGGAFLYERDGHGWESTPWHATQRAAWETLKKPEGES